MEKSPIGTLLDLMNMYRTHGTQMPEILAMHYTVQLLEHCESMHAAGIIHGDIKPDNFIVMGGSYATERILMIDFGQAIDMDMYAKGTQFTGDVCTSAFSCTEMKCGKPWTFHVSVS